MTQVVMPIATATGTMTPFGRKTPPGRNLKPRRSHRGFFIAAELTETGQVL